MEHEIFSGYLNPSQAEAVKAIEGPLLILAGAGSGKTRVLTYRIAQLIALGEATPNQILAVTFTNKAAREMEGRTIQLLSDVGIPVYEQMWISTFHSICARILREDIHHLGYQPFFGIYDDADQLSMIKKVLNALNINDKVHPAKGFQARINQAKQLGLLPDQVGRRKGFFMDDKSLEVYTRYEVEMEKANSLDFGDLLLKTYILFRDYPEVLARYRDRFQYILVDEYQDTNHIQYLIVKMLAEGHRNLCVVGDEDQSIYSWRGADITNILSFEKDFPETKVVKLEQNYRSSKTIVSAASAMIQNNDLRKNKTLFTDNDQGEKITVREERNEYEEARYVVERIQGIMAARPDKSYRDFAVFYRTNAQSRVLEDLLRSHSVPYKLVGGMKFYARKEIKDLISYMKVLLNPADDVSIKRIINVPARGIGKTTIEKVETVALDRNISFYDALEWAAEQRIVHAGACKKLQNFRFLMDKMRVEMGDMTVAQLYHLVLDSTGYAIALKDENTPEAQSRLENLEELDNAIRQFEQERGDEASLQNFLEEMALVSDVDQMEDEENSVTLMTLHVSKGLEYPVVFIVGMEEGLFPSGRAFENENEEAMEEERRLAYVGITRAREKLFLTHARTRRVWGQEQSHPPSRFLSEIPREFIETTSSVSNQDFLNRFREKYGEQEFTTSRPATRRSPKSPYSGSKIPKSDPFPDYEGFSDTDEEAEATPTQQLAKGMRVRHPTFGDGSVFAVEGHGENQKVSVLFRSSLTKKFVVKYARLQILA
ncbi:MAG: UvrD-helicase domain-containing protein [Bdellovibrionaceae bacterium]|nr:UvrD-helicase domain-containing protein [Bdellovibrionales bacterium]MCB9086510.1 UvrD-helicase domain-containing protein [Pseudobdellovibrionaceae bacterium]